MGAVVTHEGQIIAQAFNQPILSHNPCAHAEVLALGLAGKALNNYRLTGCTVYVTLEPCSMCVSAMIHAASIVVYTAPGTQKQGHWAEPLIYKGFILGITVLKWRAACWPRPVETYCYNFLKAVAIDIVSILWHGEGSALGEMSYDKFEKNYFK